MTPRHERRLRALPDVCAALQTRSAVGARETPVSKPWELPGTVRAGHPVGNAEV